MLGSPPMIFRPFFGKKPLYLVEDIVVDMDNKVWLAFTRHSFLFACVCFCLFTQMWKDLFRIERIAFQGMNIYASEEKTKFCLQTQGYHR